MPVKRITKPIHLGVDPRAGSKDLLPYLEVYGLDIQEKQRRSGDFYWKSNGPCGAMATGVEYKTLSDFVSSARSKRLMSQIRLMCEDYDRRVLLIEGDWTIGPGKWLYHALKSRWKGGHDMVQMKPGESRPVPYGEVSGLLWALEFQAGFSIWKSRTKEESAYMVAQAARKEQEGWDTHDSLGTGGIGGVVAKEAIERRGFHKSVEPSNAWKWAAQIEGFDKLSECVHHGFKSPYDMATATVEDWQAVLGPRNKWRGESIWKWIRSWKGIEGK